MCKLVHHIFVVYASILSTTYITVFTWLCLTCSYLMVHTNVCVCMYVYMYMYIYIYIYMYIYIYIHTHT
jgi:hypothetical protein